MIHAATDAELIESGHRCASPTVHLFADRLNYRVTIVEDARKDLTTIVQGLTESDPMRDQLIAVIRRLDWRYEVPHHPCTTADLRRSHRIITV